MPTCVCMANMISNKEFPMSLRNDCGVIYEAEPHVDY